MKTSLNRRRFVGMLAAGSFTSALLAACGNADSSIGASAATVPTPTAILPTPTTAVTTVSPDPTTAVPATATPTPKPTPAMVLPNKGPAPDFDNTNWLNSKPLTLAALKGTVVMMEFWTYDCFNCENVIPSLRSMYADYKDKGFTIVAMHDPEMGHERDWDNLRDAVKQYEIQYPVAQDNDFTTWNKYKINAWPTLVLVDKKGNMRYEHIGEGAYDEIRVAIQTLLAEPA